jgi:hypothetical protein
MMRQPPAEGSSCGIGAIETCVKPKLMQTNNPHLMATEILLLLVNELLVSSPTHACIHRKSDQEQAYASCNHATCHRHH